MKRLGSLALALLIAAFTLHAAAPPVVDPNEPVARKIDQALIAGAKKDSQVMANLTYLSDVIGPRLTGSANLNKAAEWAAERMKSYGLENVTLEPWTIPEGWERGKATARVIEPNTGRHITLASAGWSPGTKGKVTGEVTIIKAKTTKELESYKGKLKDAIILSSAPSQLLPLEKIVQSGSPLARAAAKGDSTKGAGFKGRGGDMEFRNALRDFLQKEGAAAMFMPSNKPLNLLVTTGGWGQGKDRQSASNRLPSLYVAHNHYEMLYRLASRENEKTRIELEVENKFIPGPVKVYNVYGEIRGSERPDEYVILGAHLDSWDLGQGTLDNGTGSCVVLETARILAKSGIKPKRTIRFVLFAGEEQGLHGSRIHAEKHKDILPNVSAVFVHDTGTGRVKGLGTGFRGPQRSILERELVSLKNVGVTDFDSPTGGGSDHQSFLRVGVPAFMCVQEAAGYVFAHHTQADCLEVAREPDLIQGAQVLSVASMRVANLPYLLPKQPAGMMGKGGFGGKGKGKQD